MWWAGSEWISHWKAGTSFGSSWDSGCICEVAAMRPKSGAKAGLGGGGGDCGFELETMEQKPSFMLFRILKAARNLPSLFYLFLEGCLS